MGSKVDFKINEDKLWRMICRSNATYQVIRSTGDAVAARANAIGSGYRTQKYYKDHKAPPVGGTQPVYSSKIRRNPTVPTSLVYTANYAAQKDNMLHNTLLKATR